MTDHREGPSPYGDGGPTAFGLSGDDDHGAADRRAGHRRGRRRGGCLPILVVLLIVAVGGWFGLRTIDVGNPFSGLTGDAEDFPDGEAGDPVVFTVSAGDSIATMARSLEDLGVVASADAYVQAAEGDDSARGIREGVYELRERLPAADVVELLSSGATRGASYTFTAGKTVEEIVTLLADDTDVPRRQFEAALERPASIGLPAEADGDAEGYLAPGSYVFFPSDDATSILSAMVERSVEEFDRVGLARAAARGPFSERELLIIASLVQAEGSLLDQRGKGKIARVIYNRLADPGETAGRLEIDATIDYIYGDKVARRTNDQIAAVADNPYNTYEQQGLPPGPIATPSESALRAAMDPVEGPWYFYVTVNLRTGETKFAVTYAESLDLVDELNEYCDTQSDRC